MAKIALSLTVDWEGTSLEPRNLLAMQIFNAEFPEYPVEHFICPSYYTRGDEPEAVTKTILSAIKPNDVISLHLHPWYSLMQKFIGRTIESPTWLPENRQGPGVSFSDSDRTDYGHDVPLGLFTTEEIKIALVKSRSLLVKANLIDEISQCRGFRSGGWMACDTIFEALEAAGGFLYDASAIPANFSLLTYQRYLRTEKGHIPLFLWLNRIWGGNPVSRPDYMANSTTHAVYPSGVWGVGSDAISPCVLLKNDMVELPATGSIADYTTFADLKKHIDTAQKLVRDEIYVSLGFHQETAADISQFDAPANNINTVAKVLRYLQNLTDNFEVVSLQEYTDRIKDTLKRRNLSYGTNF